MTNAKDSQTENPNIYYAIILLATGLIIYKWFTEVDKTILINNLIRIGIGILIVLWFFAIIFFYIRGNILQKKKAKIISQILIHTTNFIIILLFIYRISHPHIVSISFILHGSIALILFLYYNYNIPKDIIRLRQEYNTKKFHSRAEKNEIFGLIHTNLDNIGLDELKRKKEYFRSKKYSGEALGQFHKEFESKLQELNYKIKKKLLESEINQIQMTKNIEQKELDKIQTERNEILMNENSKNAVKEYNLTHRTENVILSQRLTKEEKNILRKSKHKQVNEYCAYQKKILTAFVRPIMNHSATHTFLVWSVKRLLEDFDVTKIEEHDTKDADITFIHYNKKYAIEIETGTLLRKERQLKNKVHYLNNKYPKRWFFVVSNRNLQAQYKKYGITTQRNRVSETLQKMLENTHPKKTGVKRQHTD
ncbi:TPA: hypothetical protein HA235_02060 [Candidatus Woesearchaeota archaeon]|nr:hypothetical protein [Candidatus Woesearchaeota archaeon]HIH31467.1 hypothetical protein [Candidatus Woesearchaeota archaeon]HIH55248.1 hypothetical protein [Candidatus Woesearchaeota archaeon]HIJ01967.1 hypothetical protein [Candidatus Woesearchaeota archaeon]HIJ13913.1 hypothetical protein [Candidatus Woesearchaeota archaeon]